MRESYIPLDGILQSGQPEDLKNPALAVALPWANLMERAYLPSPIERKALGRCKTPFWHVLEFSLQAEETGDSGIVPTSNFTALALLATTDQSAGFRARLRQIVDEQGNGFNFSRVPIRDVNLVGTAQRPLFLKHPYPMPNLLSLLNRTTNRAPSTAPSSGVNNIQICVYGVRDWGEVE